MISEYLIVLETKNPLVGKAIPNFKQMNKNLRRKIYTKDFEEHFRYRTGHHFLGIRHYFFGI